MKRTCQKLCQHLREEARLTLAELASLPDDANGLHVAEAALKLRDAIAAALQAAALLRTAEAQQGESAAAQGGFFDGDDAS